MKLHGGSLKAGKMANSTARKLLVLFLVVFAALPMISWARSPMKLGNIERSRILFRQLELEMKKPMGSYVSLRTAPSGPDSHHHGGPERTVLGGDPVHNGGPDPQHHGSPPRVHQT